MIRPRRFGKSLWLSILESYYDVAFEDRFEELFGKYYIGQHPTSERNKYLILSFNFAGVSPDIDRLEQSFWGHLDLTIWPEQELGKGYCDLWMAPNLVNHLGMKYSYVVEFKYLKHGATDQEVANKLEEAKEQLRRYADDKKIKAQAGLTEIRYIAVVYRAWELVKLEEVSMANTDTPCGC
ncbi:PD-(D/E)XK nuclease domain-containing protein [Butyricimonas hominis]|uniref:PD-(D/E)XK nuclease domain-containing protein n=1 Tax=Butyricimonas hominis TaxID=2763032 RepID=UPI0021060D89|nr:AAA family ATPase [Butyricimonas hominis]